MDRPRIPLPPGQSGPSLELDDELEELLELELELLLDELLELDEELLDEELLLEEELEPADTAGVVVGNDHSGSVVAQDPAGDVLRVKTHLLRPPRVEFKTLDMIGTVQIDHRQNFAAFPADFGLEITHCRKRIFNQVAGKHFVLLQTFIERGEKGQQRGAVFFDAGNFHQHLSGGVEHAADTSELGQKRFGQRLNIFLRDGESEKQFNYFMRRQSFYSAAQKTFAQALTMSGITACRS